MSVKPGVMQTSGRARVAGVARALGRVLLGFGLGVLVVLAALLAFRQTYAERIVPGVLVGSADVGGLTREDARRVLADAYAGFADGRIVLRSGLGAAVIGYRDVGREADIDAMLAAAAAVGRGGSPLDEAIDGVRLALLPVSIAPVIRFDRARLDALLSGFVRRVEVSPVDAHVLAGLTFPITPSVDGARLDLGTAAGRIEAALLDAGTGSEIALRLGSIAVAPGLSDAVARRARAVAERMSVDLVLTDGKVRWTITGASIRSWIRLEWSGTEFGPVIDPVGVSSALKPVAKAVNKPTSEALYLKDRKGRVVGVRASRDGRSLDVAASSRAIIGELGRRAAAGGAGAQLAVVVTPLPPKLATEEATRVAPLMVLQGSWHTHYVVAAHNGFGANITTPARRLNGTVVRPGQVFDFWAALGEVSFRTGYRLGGAIVKGHSVEGKALAGGICAASTTLFNAAVRAGYPILARQPHWYYITRYPLGLDATVSGSQTMRFRNDTATPILIKAFASPGYVRFEIWGVPTGRTVTWTRPLVSNVVRGSDSIQYTTTLKKGVRQRIEWPVDGKYVEISRTVRDAQGHVIRRDTFRSNYHRMVGIMLIGTG